MPKAAKTLEETIKEYENKPTSVLTEGDFPTKELEEYYKQIVAIYKFAMADRRRRIENLKKTYSNQVDTMQQCYRGNDKQLSALYDSKREQKDDKEVFLSYVKQTQEDLLKKVYFVDAQSQYYKIIDNKLYFNGYEIPELANLLFCNNPPKKGLSGVDACYSSDIFENLLVAQKSINQQIGYDGEIKNTNKQITKICKKLNFARKLKMHTRYQKLNLKYDALVAKYSELLNKQSTLSMIEQNIEEAISAYIQLDEFTSSNVKKIMSGMNESSISLKEQIEKRNQYDDKLAKRYVQERSDAFQKIQKIKNYSTIYGDIKIKFDNIVKDMMKDSKAFGSFLVTIGEKFENLDSIKAPLEEKELVKYLRSTFAQHLVERDKKELKEKRMQNLKPFTKNNAEK